MDPTLMPTIDETREMLSALVTKPTLSTRMLAKPPVAFIFAVFGALRASTGFGVGLLDEDDDEVAPAPSGRKDKLRFLVRLISLVSFALDDPSIPVRCSAVKVMSGEDSRGANSLLQGLARAAVLGEASHATALRLVLEQGEAACYERNELSRKRHLRHQAVWRGSLVRVRQRRLENERRLKEGAESARLAMVAVECAWALEEARRVCREMRRDCDRRMVTVEAAEDHIRVQNELLDKKDDRLRDRELKAERIANKARRELKKIKPLQEKLEHETQLLSQERTRLLCSERARLESKSAPSLSEDDSTLHSARSRASSTTARRRVARKLPPCKAATGAGYAAAARRREKDRRRKQVEPGEPVVEEADDNDIQLKRAYAALGGPEGDFNVFLREQLDDLHAKEAAAKVVKEAVVEEEAEEDAPPGEEDKPTPISVSPPKQEERTEDDDEDDYGEDDDFDEDPEAATEEAAVEADAEEAEEQEAEAAAEAEAEAEEEQGAEEAKSEVRKPKARVPAAKEKTKRTNPAASKKTKKAPKPRISRRTSENVGGPTTGDIEHPAAFLANFDDQFSQAMKKLESGR